MYPNLTKETAYYERTCYKCRRIIGSSQARGGIKAGANCCSKRARLASALLGSWNDTAENSGRIASDYSSCQWSVVRSRLLVVGRRWLAVTQVGSSRRSVGKKKGCHRAPWRAPATHNKQPTTNDF